MKKYIFVLLLLFSSIFIYGQNQNHILTVGKPAVSSPFSKVTVINKMRDEKCLGYILEYIGGWTEMIKSDRPVGDLVQDFFENKNAAEGKELIIIMSEFLIENGYKKGSEVAQFSTKLRFFIKDDQEKYTECLGIDTTLDIKSKYRISKALVALPNKVMNFSLLNLVENMKNSPSEQVPSYTISQISILDSIEKARMPLYKGQLKRGVYRTFDDFKNNEPSNTNFIVSTTSLGFKKVFLLEDNGELDRFATKDFFAVYEGDQLYKATIKKLLPMIFENDDFWYYDEDILYKVYYKSGEGILSGYR